MLPTEEMQHRCQPSPEGWRVRFMGLLIAGILGVLALAHDAPAQTWSTRTSNTAEHLADVIFSSGNTAVAVGAQAAGDNVTVSSDGGASWTASTQGPENLNAVFSSASTIVAVGQDEAGGDGAMVAVSNDQGASWSLPDNSTVTDGTNMADGVFVSTAITVAVGNGAGAIPEIIRSVDRGATWADAYNTNNDLLAVFSMAPTVVAVGRAQGATCLIVVSDDLGATWSRVAAGQLPGVNSDMWDAVAVDASTAVAAGANGRILRSVDNGASWSNPHTHGVGGTVYSAVASLGNTVIAVGNVGAVSRSADGGQTWADIAPPTGNDLRDVLFLTSTTLLAVGTSGTIVGSTDAGATWSAQGSGTAEQLNRLAFNDGNYTVAVGQNGTILLSTDQLSISQPIPFRSKWLLTFLLVGYGLFVLRRRLVQRRGSATLSSG